MGVPIVIHYTTLTLMSSNSVTLKAHNYIQGDCFESSQADHFPITLILNYVETSDLFSVVLSESRLLILAL